MGVVGHVLDLVVRVLAWVNDEALSFDQVRIRERDAMTRARHAKGLDPPSPASPDYVGLAFSGGGIRSATFNLGVLQGLARHKLLPHIDYLSTVSGGGYIGAWLVSWIKRRAEPDESGSPPPNARTALLQVQSLLDPNQADPEHVDLEPIRYLRRYSNYLTPSTSMFSADTWSLAAIWTRNTLLNLAIIVCVIAVALLFARFAALGLRAWTVVAATNLGGLSPYLAPEAVVSAAMLLLSAFTVSVNLSVVSRRASQVQKKATGDKVKVDQGPTGDPSNIQWLAIVPAVIAAAALSCWMYRAPDFFVDRWWSALTGFLSVMFAWMTCVGGFPTGFGERRARRDEDVAGWRPLGVVVGLIISVIAGFVTAAMLFGAAKATMAVSNEWRPWVVTAFGTPFMLVLFALGVVLQVGLIGRDIPDASREWLSRLRTWSMIYSGLWAALFAASIFGPWVLYSLRA